MCSLLELLLLDACRCVVLRFPTTGGAVDSHGASHPILMTHVCCYWTLGPQLPCM